MDGADRSGRDRVWRRIVERLKGIGVSSGIGRRSGAGRDSAHAGHPVSDRARSRGARAVGARARAPRSHEQLQQIRRRISELQGRRPRRHLRRAAPHARRSDARRPRGGARCSTSASTPSGPSSARFDEIAAVFNDVEDPYLHERKGDLHDVGRTPPHEPARRRRAAPAICCRISTRRASSIADELTPSVVAQLDWTRILGFATDAGQPHLSHGDSGALTRRAGRRRPARREPARFRQAPR